jgi:hypothetical protein
MHPLRTPLLLCTALFISARSDAGEPATAAAPALNAPVGEAYAPDFTKPLGAEWKVAKGTWTASGGELRGDEVPADKHSAVLWHPGMMTRPVKLKNDEWYPLTLEIRGDEMAASVAGTPLTAQHPFLATPKERFWFAVGGTDLRIRNLKVWDAEANPGWPKLKGQFSK